MTITVTEEARTTRFRVAPALAIPKRRENLGEDPRRHSPAPEEECLLPLRQLKRQGQLAFAWRRRRPVLDVERTSERTPAAIVLLHCGVPYAPKLPGPRYPPGTGAGCGSSLAWWNRLTTTLSGALRLS